MLAVLHFALSLVPKTALDLRVPCLMGCLITFFFLLFLLACVPLCIMESHRKDYRVSICFVPINSANFQAFQN